MARIAGVDIPREKRPSSPSPTSTASVAPPPEQICDAAGIDPSTRARDLTDAEVTQLRSVTTRAGSRATSVVRSTRTSSARWRSAATRGLRHRRGLPVGVSAPTPTPAPARVPEDRRRQEEGPQVMGKPPAGVNRPRKKEHKHVTHGVAHIKSSFNNTIITITDLRGQRPGVGLGGNAGFKGSASPPVRRPAGRLSRPPAGHGARRASKVDIVVRPGPGPQRPPSAPSRTWASR